MSGATALGSLGRPALRTLQNELEAARDQQILRVVAMVDALPRRGDADQIIAGLRPRLAALRPSRPLSFTRLLFLPLDPLIVPATAWRRDRLALPRTVLARLATLVRADAGMPAMEIDQRIAGLTMDDTIEIRRFGAQLWREAARVLASAEVPPDWSDATGLQAADFAPIARLARGALERADRIETLAHLPSGATAQCKRDTEDMLLDALEDGPDAFALLTALLTARLPRAEYVLAAADDIATRRSEPAARLAVDRAIDATLDVIEGMHAEQRQLSTATDELRRILGLLEGLDQQCAQRPSRRTRVTQLRRGIDAASRQQFSQALDSDVLRPAGQIVGADDAQIAALEQAARDLRRFETIARRIGGADHYDRSLKQAASALKPSPDDPMPTVIDRIRLIEILQGSEVAAAALPA
jgi:hypothetical protein